MRPIAGLAAATLTMLTLFAGAGSAIAAPATTASTGTTTTTTGDHSQGNAGTEGDYNQPQPESNADQNSGGANGKCPDGPYCSTRDGSASENGNGEGEAKGKPCAGCVGKADNKNPKGQYPNGSDKNAGYECDRNQGIGQGNPAHTGCTGEEQPPTAGGGKHCRSDHAMRARSAKHDCAQCSTDSSMSAENGDDDCTQCSTDTSMSGENSDDDCMAASGRGRLAARRAGSPVAGGSPLVAGTAATSGAGRPAAVLGVQATRAGAAAGAGVPERSGVAALAAAVLPDAVLPNTGAGATLVLFLVAGVLMVLAGAGVLVLRRRTARI